MLDIRREWYHILAHHSTYNREELRKVLSPETVYVGCVRSVVRQYESLFRYYNLGRPYPYFNTSYKGFVRGLLNYTKLAQGVRMPPQAPLRNAMLFDFGVTPGGGYLPSEVLRPEHTNTSFILRSIQGILQDFDLILIADRMDESLVLLADLLCWPLDQVVTISHTVMKNSGSSAYKLDKELEDIVLWWNHADDMFYQMALAVFIEKKNRYGTERMARDVARLRGMRDRLTKKCERTLSLTEEEVEECEMLGIWEPFLTYILKVRLWPQDKEQFGWDQDYFCDKMRGVGRQYRLMRRRYCSQDALPLKKQPAF